MKWIIRLHNFLTLMTRAKIQQVINLHVCCEREFYSILLANTKKHATAKRINKYRAENKAKKIKKCDLINVFNSNDLH